jgi:hypothetical protein
MAIPQSPAGSDQERGDETVSSGDGTIVNMTAGGTEAYRPAGLIEPHWQVLVDGQWLTVDTVVETERPDGVRLIHLYFVDHRPAVALKSDLVRSRTPEQIR